MRMGCVRGRPAAAPVVLTALSPCGAQAAMLIPVGIILYTVAGGLKATFISSYVHTVIIYVVGAACALRAGVSGIAYLSSILLLLYCLICIIFSITVIFCCKVLLYLITFKCCLQKIQLLSIMW